MITWGFAAPGEETERLSRWVADRIWPGKGRDFGRCRALAVLDGERLIAGMIYHNYDDDAGVVEVSGAGVNKRWLTRRTLQAMFAVPFIDWQCQAVVMRVSDGNRALHRMLTAYGFTCHRIPRLRGRNEAENIFVLTDEAWRENRFQR